MYTLIVVIGMLSPATSAVVPVGLTSQAAGKFKTNGVSRETAATSNPIGGGTIADLGLTRGAVYWYCVFGRRVNCSRMYVAWGMATFCALP